MLLPPRLAAHEDAARCERRERALIYTRRVRIKQVVMERSETLLNCHDLDKNEDRQFKLDRIEHAEVLEPLSEEGAA